MSSSSYSNSDDRRGPDGGGAAPDAQDLEDTRQQIRSLVAEIAQLAKSNCSPEEFYQQFLDRVFAAMAPAAAAVWVAGDDGRLGLQYQVNLQQTRLAETEESQQRHGQLLGRLFNGGEPALVPPQSGAGGNGDGANPTDFLLVVGLLQTDLGAAGLVEIFQRPDVGPNTQRGWLRFVVQMCDLAGDYLRGHQLRRFSDRQSLWTQLEEFCRVVHASLNPRETAYTIANEGRRLIECDRLSVAIRRGRRCVIEAVSGQDVFDRRANSVRLLERLAAAVTAAGDTVWFSGDTRDLPPQVEEAVQNYVDESHSKTIGVLPLRRPEPEPDPTAPRRGPPAPPLGALIVERIEDSRLPASMLQRVEVVSRHSAAALANALDHHSLFLMPLWRALGRSRVVVAARNLPKTISIGGAILALVLALCLWPKAFWLESKGTLEPIVRQNVYAGAKGRVSEVCVQHGSLVTEGEVLVRLRDPELEIGITDATGQLATTTSRIESLRQSRIEGKGISLEERSRVAADLAEAEEKQRSLTKQLELLRGKEKELAVRSPIAGQVITWDLDKRLANLPVQRGHMLLQVADLGAAWQLELHMPEHRMGHVARAWQAKQQAKNADDRKVEVEFQLATNPGRTYRGTVREIELNAEVRGEEGSSVLVKVEIDKKELPALRPGTTVTGKVYCGIRPLGYVWLHDVWAFIQSRIIFRYF